MGFLGKLFNKEEPIKEVTINHSGAAFHMVVEDVFNIVSSGPAVVGRVDSGEIHVGDTIIIDGNKTAKVSRIEMSNRTANVAKAGENCGLHLEGITRNEVGKGSHLTIQSRGIPDTHNQEIPVNQSGAAFHMVIEDAFTVIGKGTVVTGRVDSGEVHVGQPVMINGSRQTKVLRIDKFRKTLDVAKAGDVCGIYLEGIAREEINRGDYLSN